MAACCVFWGTAFISTKVLFAWFTPYALTQYRFLVAAAAILAAVLAGGTLPRAAPADMPRLALCGLTGIFGYYVCNNVGMKFVSASLASILCGAIPVLAALVETVVYRRRLSGAAVAGVLLSVAGIGLVVGCDLGAGSASLWKGCLLMLAASACWVAFCFLSVPLYGRYSSLTIAFYQTLFGVAFCFALLPRDPVGWRGMGLAGWGNLLFIGGACSAAVYVMYNYAVERLDVMVCTVMTNMVPVVTIAAGALLLGERLGPPQFLGAALILAGVLLVARAKRT